MLDTLTLWGIIRLTGLPETWLKDDGFYLNCVLESGKRMKEKYDVIGMTCAACHACYKTVSRLPGVKDVNVNLLQNP